MANATVSYATPLESVPLNMSGGNVSNWILKAAQKVNKLLQQRVTLLVTLAPSATTSVINDSRINPFSVISLVPQTADAKTAFLAGIYVVPGSGTATINHASSANADQTFACSIYG